MPANLKEKIRQAILLEMRAQQELLANTVAEAKEAATHDDAKQEGKYDTRAIESGYLAGAQAERLRDLENRIAFCENMSFKSVGDEGSVAIGSLIETQDSTGSTEYYLILELIGGMKAIVEDKEIRVIASESNAALGLLELYAEDDYKFGSKSGIVVSIT